MLPFSKNGGINLTFLPLLDGNVTTTDNYSGNLFLSSGATGSVSLSVSVFGV